MFSLTCSCKPTSSTPMAGPASTETVYQRVDPGADINRNERKWRMIVWDTENTFGGGVDGKMDVNVIQDAIGHFR